MEKAGENDGGAGAPCIARGFMIFAPYQTLLGQKNQGG